MTSRYAHLDSDAYALREAGASYSAIVAALDLRAMGPHPRTGSWTASPATAREMVAREAARRGVPIPGPSRPRVRIEPQIPRPNLSTPGRRFGVEIEVANLTPAAAARILTRAGIPARAESYSHATPGAAWKVTTDASVSCGCEVVTPPLSGEAGYDLVRRAMAALRQGGGRIDNRCGLHVHHEVTDLTGEELARLVEAMSRHARGMDALVARSRRNGGWARHLTSAEVARYAAAFRAYGDRPVSMTGIRSDGIGGRPDSRYRTLNVHCFPAYGTVEFRQHQGTLNGTKAVAWVRMGQAMIEAARAADTLDATNLVADLAAAGHLPADVAEFLNRRAASLA